MTYSIIPTLMIDIAGETLDTEDERLLASPYVAGVILFKRNVVSPAQVRALTDSIRAINPTLIIATDQEGGRVARLKDGFSPLPAMGRLGDLYDQDPERAVSLACDVGYLMACEVLAVGIDISFAPVLDIDNGSLVIGDRAFHQDTAIATTLATALIQGMNKAGMKATGKHFPGHGSVVPDSHIADACDGRCFDEIWGQDLAVFQNTLSQLGAIMPAHIVFECIDNKPAGFSKIWLQDILRQKMGFDGAIFSDDLTMKAAHIAGGVFERTVAALTAGCDVALICNDREGARAVIDKADGLPRLSHNRFGAMKSVIPAWQGDLADTCHQFADWQATKERVAKAFFVETGIDPTDYKK